MADVRSLSVSVGFDINSSPIAKLNKQMDEMKKLMSAMPVNELSKELKEMTTGAVDVGKTSQSIDELKRSADEAVISANSLKESMSGLDPPEISSVYMSDLPELTINTDTTPLEAVNTEMVTLKDTTQTLKDKMAEVGQNEELARLRNKYGDIGDEQLQMISSLEKEALEAEKTAAEIKNLKDKYGDLGDEQLRNIEALDKSSAALATAGAAISAAGVGIFAGMKKAINVSAPFNQQLSKVGAKSGATADELEELKDTAVKLNLASSLDLGQVAEGMDDMATKGFEATDIMAAMPGIIAATEASGENMAIVSDTVTSALNAFNMEAASAGHIADVMAMAANKSAADVSALSEAFKYAAPVANTLGVSLEGTAAMTGVLSDAGIKGSQAGTTLKKVMMSLSAPNTQAAKTLKSLGIQTQKANGELLTMPEILNNMKAGMDGLSSTKKMDILKTLFGEEGASGASVLLEQGDKIQEFTRQLVESDGAAAEASKKMLDNYAGDMAKLQSSWSSAMMEMGSIFEEAARPFVQVATKAVNWFLDLPAPVKKFVAALSGIGGVAASAVGGLLLIGAAVPKVTSGIQLLTSGIKKLKSMSFMIGGLTQGFSKLGAVIKANPLMFWLSVIMLLVVWIKHLWDTNEKFRNSVTKAWEGIKTFFKGVGEVLGFYWEGIKAIWEGIKKVFGWIGKLFGFGKDEGTDLVAGLAEGIDTSSSKVLKSATNLGDQVTSGVSDSLEIHSPSRVMRELGANISQGLAEGISDKAKDVTQATEDLLPSGIVKTIEPDISVTKDIAVDGRMSNLLGGIASWMTSKFSGAGLDISSIWKKIKGTFTRSWTDIRSTTSSAAQNVYTTMTSKLGMAKKDTQSKLADISSAYALIGESIVDGLIAGMDSKMAELQVAVSRVSDTVRSGVEDPLEIHSPSRVMQDIGGDISAGLTLGIQDGMDDVRSAMSGMVHQREADVQEIGSGYDSVPSQTTTNNSSSSQLVVNQKIEINITGAEANDDRALASRMKAIARDAFAEAYASFGRTNPRVTER